MHSTAAAPGTGTLITRTLSANRVLQPSAVPLHSVLYMLST